MLNIIKQYIAFTGSDMKLMKQGVFWQFIKSIGVGLQLAAFYVVLKDLVHENLSTKTAWQSLLIMMASLIIIYVASYMGRIKEAKSSFDMCAHKRLEIGDRLKYLPMGYFNKTSLGKITATATNTLESLQNEGTMIVMGVFSGLINTVVMIIFLTIFDYRMGILVLAGVVLFLLINVGTRKASEASFPERHESQVALVGVILEYIQGLSVIRSYNLAKEASGKLNKGVDECEKNNIRLEFKVIPYIFIQTLALKLVSVGVIALSIALYIQGTMATEITIVMFIASFMMFQELEVAGAVSGIGMLVDRSIHDVKKQLAIPTMQEPKEEKVANAFDIKGENISFSYEKRKIIDNITFEIKEGTTTAIVGPSGGGKTTICNLITRFWDVDEGQITLGGNNVKDYKVDHLLSNFSMVFQNVYLFNDTVLENLKIGRPDATMKEVEEAAKKACCHDFITSLPEGYNTIIGEGGSSISGGEKQRLSIARAILKDCPVIILDEATANVDPENERDLQKAIEELTKEKTIIMIAHRLKTVQQADQILVVDGGKITERGSHEQLMENEKTYANFVKMREKSIGWKV